MSGSNDVLGLKEDDTTKLLAAGAHLASDNVNYQMDQYVFKRRPDGNYFIFYLIFKYSKNLLVLSLKT